MTLRLLLRQDVSAIWPCFLFSAFGFHQVPFIDNDLFFPSKLLPSTGHHARQVNGVANSPEAYCE